MLLVRPPYGIGIGQQVYMSSILLSSSVCRATHLHRVQKQHNTVVGDRTINDIIVVGETPLRAVMHHKVNLLFGWIIKHKTFERGALLFIEIIYIDVSLCCLSLL